MGTSVLQGLNPPWPCRDMWSLSAAGAEAAGAGWSRTRAGSTRLLLEAAEPLCSLGEKSELK